MDEARAGMAHANKLASRGCQRHERDIVLVIAPDALPFSIEHTNDCERHASNAHNSANRIGVSEQLVPKGLSQSLEMVVELAG